MEKQKQGFDLEMRDVRAAVHLWTSIARDGNASTEIRDAARQKLAELAQRMDRLIERIREAKIAGEIEEVECVLAAPIFASSPGYRT